MLSSFGLKQYIQDFCQTPHIWAMQDFNYISIFATVIQKQILKTIVCISLIEP